ncbi:MAG: RNA polymerase sigma factor [Bryobacteraceae bacterium]
MECAATSQLMVSIADHVAADIGDLDSILRLYRPKVFRFILVSLRDKDAAETLTQDCFFKAYRARDRFRHECSLETWLMQIAVNLVRDYSRNRRFQFWKRTQVLAKPVEGVQDWLSDGQHSPETAALLKEEIQAIWNTADHLPEKQRTVFLLRFVEDMDLLEIATATGMKEGTVKTHLFRALQTVRERMGART